MQSEIIKRAIAIKGKKIQFLNWWNEGMGRYAITRQTLYKWENGGSKPDPRILEHALAVYAPDDPRYQIASELLGCYITVAL